MDLSIIIPCYNEIENVPKIREEFFPVAVKLAEDRSVEVIFVDDGSVDGTFDALSAAFKDNFMGILVKIERHNPNQGLGAAIRTGFAASQGEVVVTTDCDGTYRFSEIPNLLSHLTPDIDIVTASPYHPDGDIDGVPGYRLVLSRGSSTMYRLLARREVHTYTALFRAYRRSVIDNVPFTANGFLAGTELLVHAIRMGYQVTEYPTILHSRVHGESKAKLARTIQAHLNFQIQVLLPFHPYGTLIQGTGQSVYLYVDDQKHLFPSAEIFLSHGYHWDQIVQVNDDYLDTLPDGPSMKFREGTLIKGSDNTVYIIEHDQKRPFPTAEIFETLGYRWQDIIKVPDVTLTTINNGKPVSTDNHPDGTIVKSPKANFAYLLDGGQKRWFPTEQAFLSWGYEWDQIITITDEELDSYPDGPPITPQESFYLKNIQDALKVHIRTEDMPQENIFIKLPQLIDSITNKSIFKELPGHLQINSLRTLF